MVHRPTDRKALRAQYGTLLDEVSAILFRIDPIGINFERNVDEYDLEAGTIVPRLPACARVEDVQRIVHEEFVKWFDGEIAGPPERYRVAAAEIWQAWHSGFLGERAQQAVGGDGATAVKVRPPSERLAHGFRSSAW